MKQRVITAVVALIVFIPIIVAGGIWVKILAALLGIVAMSEILIMKKRIVISMESILAYVGVIAIIVPGLFKGILPGHINEIFIVYLVVLLLLLGTVISKNRFSFDDVGVMLLGMLYIGTGFHYFINARELGLPVLMYALFIVWLTDSGAYLFGRKIGKHKLAPRVSPNKTWEGSICGSLLATVGCVAWTYFYPLAGISIFSTILMTIVLSIGGQFGDLIESAFKRHYGVKDSGKILPGHGGILDRFDSLLIVLPLLHLFAVI